MNSPVEAFKTAANTRIVSRFTTEAVSDSTTFNDPANQILTGQALYSDPLPRCIMKFQMVQDRTKDSGGFRVIGIFRCWGRTEDDAETLAGVIINEMTDDSDILDIGASWNVIGVVEMDQDDAVASYEEDQVFMLVTVRITWQCYEIV